MMSPPSLCSEKLVRTTGFYPPSCLTANYLGLFLQSCRTLAVSTMVSRLSLFDACFMEFFRAACASTRKGSMEMTAGRWCVVESEKGIVDR